MSETRVVFITDGGIPKTGLTPTFSMLKNVATAASITFPTVTELGNGFYKFDITIPIGVIYAGVVDAGSSLSYDGERYIPIVMAKGDTDTIRADVYLSPSYDEDEDTLQFISYLLMNGSLNTADVASISVTLYDSTGLSIGTATSSSPVGGIFLPSVNSPGLVSGNTYYAIATITTANGITYSSVETCIALD